MRFIIFGLSFIFFTLSAIITVEALELPGRDASYQEARKEETLEANNVIKQLAEQQDANKAIVAELQGKIAQLEDKLKTKDQAPESIKAADSENRPRTLAVFGGETFRPGKIAINDAALSIIDNFVGDISAAQGKRVLIEGHTDNIPTGKQNVDNMNLSLRRAKVIADVLVARGISSERISVVGYGDAQPIESNDTEEGRAKNRRVEVKLMSKEEMN